MNDQPQKLPHEMTDEELARSLFPKEVVELIKQQAREAEEKQRKQSERPIKEQDR